MKKSRLEIIEIYNQIKDQVKHRLDGFSRLRASGTEKDIFEELVFCLMTPQTKARQADKAVRLLKEEVLLFEGTKEKLAGKLNIVRFRNNKAQYICYARTLLCPDGKPGLKRLLDSIPDKEERRDWLVKNIKGFGYKEASHFLRNTGYGPDFAILDRHVIRNLAALGVLKKGEAGNSTNKKYLEIEKKMIRFSKDIGVPMDYLDFVFLYKGMGDIFK